MMDETSAHFPFQWDKERLYNAAYESMRADGSWDEEQCAIVIEELTKLLLLADDYYSDGMDEEQIGNAVFYRLSLIMDDRHEDSLRLRTIRMWRMMGIVAQWLNERGCSNASRYLPHGQLLWLMLMEIKRDGNK